MSKKAIVVIISIVAAIVMIAGVFLISKKIGVSKSIQDPADELEEERKNSVLTCMNEDEINRFIENTEWKGDSFNYHEDGFYALYGIDLLGFNANVETEIDDAGNISYLLATIVVFPEHNVEHGNDEDEPVSENDPPPIFEGNYEFTEEDKTLIEQQFIVIRDAFADYLECGGLERYDIMPTLLAGEGEFIPEENEDKFFAGEYTREYSIKDKNGTIWFLTVEASFGSATASIYKAVDTSAYDGFWPIIDMTKTYD